MIGKQGKTLLAQVIVFLINQFQFFNHQTFVIAAITVKAIFFYSVAAESVDFGQLIRSYEQENHLKSYVNPLLHVVYFQPKA